MTIFAGLVEIGLSRIWTRLRTFIPPETAGMVVVLVGVTIGLAALRQLLGDQPGGSVSGHDALVTGVTLAVMIGLNIWNPGRLRLFCILVGMMAGYVLSGFTGHITWPQVAHVLEQPLVVLPTVSHLSWSLDWSLLVPFAVTGLAAAMGATAVITTYQRLTDADWVRPDDVSSFIERAGGAWGARRDVITRVEHAAQQAVEAVAEFCEPKGPLRLSVSYDEFDIDAKLAYDGMALELPDRPPSQDEILETEHGHRRLSGFLVKRQADRAHNTIERGVTILHLHFGH
jgi:hypothetical protein